MNIPLTLSYLRPGEEWALDGDEYSGLSWLCDTKKPTEAELLKAEPAAQAAHDAAIKAAQQNTADAIAHAKSLGFTDGMIAAMYPALITLAP